MLLWESEGPILLHYEVKGETINCERYTSLIPMN